MIYQRLRPSFLIDRMTPNLILTLLIDLKYRIKSTLLSFYLLMSHMTNS